jgi:thioredoxin-related protein
MKKIMLLSLAAIVFAAVYAFQTTPETLAIGDMAPKASLKMKNINGRETSLNDAKMDNGLLVIFSCNTCPFVVGGEGSEGWEGRYEELREFSAKNNMGMVLINSNEAKREKGDDLESMKTRAKEHGFSKCNYLLDVNSELANAFFARTTPHVYLFDKNMKLVYKGSIDDNVDDSKKVTAPYLKNAIGNLAAGKAIDPAETKPVGCSIKRAS